MNRHAVHLLAILFTVSSLMSACSTVQTNPDTSTATAIAKTLVQSTKSWDGQSLPAYPQGQPEITILRISIPAGTKLATHKHPVINAGVLVSGQLTVVTQDGKTLHLNAGDPIIEVVNTLHHGFNPGPEPAEILVFYAGKEGLPITVLEK